MINAGNKEKVYEMIRGKVLSYSSLKEFARSPEHFVKYLLTKKEPTPAMMFGSLLDKMILTPGTWQDEFTVMPVFDRRTAAGKAAYAEFVTLNAGKTFVTEEDIVNAEFISAKVFQNEQAAELLAQITKTQFRAEYTDKKTGLKICGYLDGKGDGIIMDLKSTKCADPEDFLKSIFNFDYDLQAAVYLTAIAQTHFEFPDYKFLCVETASPYGISVCKLDDSIVEYGKERLRNLLDNFKYCLDNELFHQSYEFKYKFGPAILTLPNWKRK